MSIDNRPDFDVEVEGKRALVVFHIVALLIAIAAYVVSRPPAPAHAEAVVNAAE